MERLEGLDEEFQKEETEKVTSIEETKKKRPPFHYWEVAGVQHKMKLNTGMITKLENKYRTNIMAAFSMQSAKNGKSQNETPTFNIYVGGRKVTDVVVEEINHRTKSTGVCPILV